jgi:hypothetical protein
MNGFVVCKCFLWLKKGMEDGSCKIYTFFGVDWGRGRGVPHSVPLVTFYLINTFLFVIICL